MCPQVCAPAYPQVCTTHTYHISAPHTKKAQADSDHDTSTSPSSTITITAHAFLQMPVRVRIFLVTTKTMAVTPVRLRSRVDNGCSYFLPWYQCYYFLGVERLISTGSKKRKNISIRVSWSSLPPHPSRESWTQTRIPSLPWCWKFCLIPQSEEGVGLGTESNSHADVCCFHSVDILNEWHHAGEPCSKAPLHMRAQTPLR